MERMNNISLLRLICTISVLIFHIFFMFAPADINFNFYYLSFGVQILCFASGLLYSQKDIQNTKCFLKKSVAKIAIPTIIFILIIIFLDSVILLLTKNFTFSNLINSMFGYRVSNGKLVMQIANLWFIPIYLLCYLLLPFFQKVFKNPSTFNITILILIMLIEILLAFTPVVYPFICGYFIGKYKYNSIVKHQNKKWLYILLLIAILVICMLGRTFSYLPILPNRLTKTLSYLFQGLCGIFISILFLIVFQFTNKFRRVHKLFDITDGFCISIYLANQAFMIGILNVWGLTNNMLFDSFIIFIETITCAFVVNSVSNLILNRIFKNKGSN